MLEIFNAPNPLLSQKTKKVFKIDKTTLQLIAEMKETLGMALDPIGVGLAAPQVGISLKIFLAKPTPKSNFFVFINPSIIAQIDKLSKATQAQTNKNSNKGRESSGRRIKKLEGCLSLTNIWGEVERYHEIQLRYQDETGKLHNRKFKGFMSTIIQHEMDHLDGILFTKRVLEQKGTLYKSEKNEKGEDIFEELKI